ncbi:hypothetical protein [uncultured Empedobacter sp.]|uniref:hypothetical protein n=1 Tax=uncultured Empedobacter sp. TaxID=410844 RepID=UPI0025DE36A6|nr:hypothetical protein [uncultured Empedobacter sp.]
MADEIEIGSKAIKQIQQLKDELVAADQALIKLSQNALQAGKNIGGITTPGGLSKSGNENTKAIADVQRLKTEYASLQNQIQTLTIAKQKLATQNNVTNNSINNASSSARANAVANQIARAETDRNIRATTLLGGAYARASAQLLVLKKEAKDLAIIYGENSVQAKRAANAALELDGRIKAVDKSVGDSQRNVGNYSSALTKGLGSAWSIVRQLAYLLPGLGVAGILGFALEPLINYVKTLGIVKKGVEENTKAIEEKTKAEENERQVISSKQSEEITRSTLLFQTAKNLTLTYTERSKAVKDLKERYPDYLKGISDEKILAGEASEAEEKLNKALVNRGLALASQQMLQESITDSLKNEKKLSDELSSIQEKRTKILKEFRGVEGQEFSQNEKVQKRLEERNLQLQRLFYLEGTVNDQYRDRKSLIQQDITFFTKQYNENAKYLDIVKETNKETDKSKRNRVTALNLEGVAVGTTIQQLDKYIDMLETELILNAGNEEAYKNISIALEQVKKAKSDLITGGGEIISTANIKEVYTEVDVLKTKLSELQEQYLKSFVDEFASNSGFSETFKILNEEIDGFGENFSVTFNAIAESAQEAFNFISNASQQNFDSEKERLQSQYEVALTYAGENKAAQEKLANELEKQKKDIANRENKAKQKQAIFNIAIDTAQGIISALASTPPNVPLSIFIGALGAAQIALVASQKVPQYWMGGTHDGGLMMVNDGSGSNYRETIVTPDGNIHKPQGKNVLMNAPAGTEIFTHDQWNDQMNNMLKGNGINWNMPVNNNSYSGLSKDDLEEVMLRTLGEQSQHHTIFDANGVVSYINKKGNITKSSSNRGNSIKTRFT